MRFQDDPKYGDIMSRFRLGQVTQEDIDLLNTRVLSSTLLLPSNKHVPYMAISHVLRESINRMSLFKHAEFIQQQVHTIYAIPSRSKRFPSFNLQQLRAIRLLSENQTQFMPTTLNLFVGMHIMVTHNVNLDAGIVNGTLAVIDDIDFDNESVLDEIKLSEEYSTL
jgi:hypothetical protein